MNASGEAPNRELLDQVNAAGKWFQARKTQPIWARRLDAAERVVTLEGEEEVPAGSYLCRGEAGDVWPQAPERLIAKYEATDETTSDGWQKYRPKPDVQGVLAARVEQPFELQTAWGRLRGKSGDTSSKTLPTGTCPTPMMFGLWTPLYLQPPIVRSNSSRWNEIASAA